MGLALRQSISQKIQQRLVLRLVQKVEVPDDWDFQEPEPMTPVIYEKGGAHIDIPEIDIASYAAGCKQIAGIIEQEKPSVVLVSMRGGKPVSRCAEQFLENEYQAVEAKTSYFLGNLSTKLNRALRLCRKNGNFGKLLMVDTSVSGTKLSWFMPQMLGDLSNSVDYPLDFVSTILWHNKDGWYEETQNTYGTVNNRNYNIGVRNLICEDNPTLLGVQYDSRTDFCARKARGKVRAYDVPEQASIRVLRDGNNDVYPLHFYNGSIRTADLFAMLVKEYAQDLHV